MSKLGKMIDSELGFLGPDHVLTNIKLTLCRFFENKIAELENKFICKECGQKAEKVPFSDTTLWLCMSPKCIKKRIQDRTVLGSDEDLAVIDWIKEELL